MQQTLYNRLRAIFYRLFDNPLIQQVVRNTGYLFSANGISAALSFVQSVLVIRYLGVEGYGILKPMVTFTSTINKFASFRMGELVIKYVNQALEQEDTELASAVFKAAATAEMLASIVGFGLAVLLAPLGALYLAKDPAMTNWFIVYGLIILANLVTESATGLLQVFDRYRHMAALTVVQSIFTLSVIVVVYITGGGFLGILLAYLGGKAIGALGLTIAAVREAGRHWGSGWWRASFSRLQPLGRELAHFAVSTNLSASLSLVNKDSEGLLVSFFRGPVESGYYYFALSLINLVQMPVQPLPQSTYPILSREVTRRNWGNVNRILRQGSFLAGGYTLAAGLFLALLGVPLIRYVYTPEYLPAYPALLILLVGFLFANTFYWHRTALLSLGRPDFPTRVNLALALFKLVGLILLVPRFGFLASAGLLATSYVLGVSVSALKVRSLLAERQRTTPAEAA